MRLVQHDTVNAGREQRGDAPSAGRLGVEPVPGPARSLYIHIPFCTHKCHYCDFYSIVDRRDRQAAFVDRLAAELAAVRPWAGGAPLRTIFVGGGTPSLLRPELWRRLLRTLDRLYDLGEIRSDRGEFTVECNPETVTPDLVRTLADGGVNRISLGAQTFDPGHLAMLERRHDPAGVAPAVELCHGCGIRRVSLDLIYAIPGQTARQWAGDLRRAADLGVEHLSCYCLTYEPNTPMTARLARGEFVRASEETEAELYEIAVSVLAGYGLARYEVSNFARPGAECSHNLAYWRAEQWLAAGPSAAAHVGGHRWKNVPRLDDYLCDDGSGFSRVVDHEPPDASRALREKIMMGLRLAEGLDEESIIAEAGRLDSAAPGRASAAIERQRTHGTIRRDRLALTDAGFLVADAVAAALMEAVG